MLLCILKELGACWYTRYMVTWCMLVYQVHGNVVHAGIQRMKSIIAYVIISKGSIFIKHISTVNLPLNRRGKLKKVVCVFVHC